MIKNKTTHPSIEKKKKKKKEKERKDNMCKRTLCEKQKVTEHRSA
jgi:hypothetical protein